MDKINLENELNSADNNVNNDNLESDFADISKLYKKIEAILFLSGEEVRSNELSDNLEMEVKDLEAEMDKLKAKKDSDSEDIYEIIKIDSNLLDPYPAYKLAVKKRISDEVISFFDKSREPKITPKAMEVLSIIAYNQNITRAQIESIRGVASDSLVSRLLDLGLIKEGKEHETLGRPMGYITTDKFLMVFGLEGLSDLPEMKDVDIKKESEKYI